MTLIDKSFLQNALASRDASFENCIDFLTQNISIDSRKLKMNSLFMAIKGHNLDGHNFIDQAFENQVCAVIAASNYAKTGEFKTNNVILVDDTLLALQDIARAYLAQKNILKVALTGSNGKTTTKELIKHALNHALGENTFFASRGNLNNHIGVPLSILEVNDEHQIGVFEMGMNHFGEIKTLSEIVRPNIALICNIGNAHAGNLGGISGVVTAKGELFEALKCDATAIINIDDPNCVKLAQKFDGKKLTFGYSPDADLQITHVSSPQIDVSSVIGDFNFGSQAVLKNQSCEVALNLNIPGKHNIANAAAAAAVCLACGVNLAKAVAGMAKMKLVSGRLDINRLKSGALLINDTYNANPESVKASLELLECFKNGRKIVLLGDMLELDEPEVFHQQIGALCVQKKTDLLFACGRYAGHTISGSTSAGFKSANTMQVTNSALLAKKLAKIIKKNDIVLIKGSRALKMEIILEYLI